MLEHLVKRCHQTHEGSLIVPERALAAMKEVQSYRTPEGSFLSFVGIIEVEPAPATESNQRLCLHIDRDIKLFVFGRKGVQHPPESVIHRYLFIVVVDREKALHPTVAIHPINEEGQCDSGDTALATFEDDELVDSTIE